MPLMVKNAIFVISGLKTSEPPTTFTTPENYLFKNVSISSYYLFQKDYCHNNVY